MSETTTSRDYALLLLARTRLTYNQISELTGISINKIGAWAQENRPKEVRDENVLGGVQPDIQEELIRLKQEMETGMKAQGIPVEVPEPIPVELIELVEEKQTQTSSEQNIIRHHSFKYFVKSNRPVKKELVLAELNEIAQRIEGIGSDEVELYITIEGA